MSAEKEPDHLRLASSLVCAATLTALVLPAMAQPSTAPKGAVSGALGSPAQAKSAAPAAAATVKPGTGGSLAGRSSAAEPGELAAAIAAGDIRKALDLGASARDIATMLQAKYPTRNIDPNSAVFVKTPDGRFAIAYAPNPPAIGRSLWVDASFGDYSPPGGVAALPTAEEAMGPMPPPPPPSPAMAAVGQMFLAGGSPQAVANAMLQAQPLPADAPPFDVSSARYVQGPDGAVGLAMTTPDGQGIRVSRIPGSESYPGYASLPTIAQAFPQTAPRPGP